MIYIFSHNSNYHEYNTRSKKQIGDYLKVRAENWGKIQSLLSRDLRLGAI